MFIDFLIYLAHIDILPYTFKYCNSLLQFQYIESLLLITDLFCHLYNYAGSPDSIGKREYGDAFSKKEKHRGRLVVLGKGRGESKARLTVK